MVRGGKVAGCVKGMPQVILLVCEVRCCMGPPAYGRASGSQGNPDMLFEVSNSCLNSALHGVIVANYYLKDDMLCRTILRHLFAPEFRKKSSAAHLHVRTEECVLKRVLSDSHKLAEDPQRIRGFCS